jgi:hypothetical protein
MSHGGYGALPSPRYGRGVSGWARLALLLPREEFFNRLAHYRPHHTAGQIARRKSGTLCCAGSS